MKAWIYASPLGQMVLTEEDGAITGVDFGEMLPPNAEVSETALLKRCAQELEEYFAGVRKRFDLPLMMQGTAFQKRVWQALAEIPYGEVCSYGDIARAIGSPKACRAVGGANNRNPIAIIIPCHRVIGADGKLVGYGGGLDKKEALLALERRVLEERSC